MSEKQSAKKSLFSTANIMVVLFVAGLVVGAAAQHYYIEPFIANTFGEQLNECFSQKQLLDKEINNCYVERENCRKACPT